MFDKSSDTKPNIKTIYKLTLNSLGKIHFAAVVKSSYLSEQNDENDNSKDDSENLLKKIDVFYCDNRGVTEIYRYFSLEIKI